MAVVKLRRNLAAGRTVRNITSPRFDVPTTIARSGGRNYVVNEVVLVAHDEQPEESLHVLGTTP